ncbi:IclR family transcriptional regulator [Xinfangfangia sp. CPCC 101601]|uniref:IclR family transcriptional regulator n=1 Tax=Pseudogemmobacter lacusdianii TaxID=3069608 RepID=A0ABU0VXQ2_9RHOB|nr:IclR family transcriptional regulator [Xinfangfangia sp. CPCC 101601]MDQ2066526.1 IclR family transcriptional regulator [Xinfangfangia sp. CPCC 101601]
MGTVSKALELLDLFTQRQPQLGLSQIAREAGLNKATCHRLLQEMEGAGFVEQTGPAREYRLGPAVLRLAALREAAVPTQAAAMPALRSLAEVTGETAHLSRLVAGRLQTIGFAYGTQHSMMVRMEDADFLPFHATASGMVVLAFQPDSLAAQLLGAALPQLTQSTATDPAAFLSRLPAIRARGHAETESTFEPEVHGLALPLFDANSACLGSIAVATPAARMGPDQRQKTLAALVKAAAEITRAWGGQLPPGLETLWRDVA